MSAGGPRGLVLLVSALVSLGLAGCGQVETAAQGTYPLSPGDAQYAAVGDRLFGVTHNQDKLDLSELTNGSVNPVASKSFSDRILNVRTASDKNQFWIGVTLCVGKATEDTEHILCSGGLHVELLTATTDGKFQLQADSADFRTNRTMNERLHAGPFRYRDSVMLEVTDDVTGATQRLVLRDGKLAALSGDDGQGVVCATGNTLFRERSTPDFEHARNVNLAVERWDDSSWVEIPMNIDESTTSGLSIACSDSSALVLEQQKSGGNLVRVSSEPASPKSTASFLNQAGTLVPHGGDPTEVLLSTVDLETASVTVSLLDSGSPSRVIGPSLPGGEDRVVFVVRSPGQKALLGTAHDGRLEVSSVS